MADNKDITELLAEEIPQAVRQIVLKDDFQYDAEDDEVQAEEGLDHLAAEKDDTLKHFFYNDCTVFYNKGDEAKEGVRAKIGQERPMNLILGTEKDEEEEEAHSTAIAKILEHWVATAKDKKGLVFTDKGNPEKSFKFGIEKNGKTTYQPAGVKTFVAAHVRSQYFIPSSVQSFSVGDGKSELGWTADKITITGKTTEKSKDQDFTLKIDPPEACKDDIFKIDTTKWHRAEVVIQLGEHTDIEKLTFTQGNGEDGTRDQVYKFIDKNSNPINLSPDQKKYLKDTCKIKFETTELRPVQTQKGGWFKKAKSETRSHTEVISGR